MLGGVCRRRIKKEEDQICGFRCDKTVKCQHCRHTWQKHKMKIEKFTSFHFWSEEKAKGFRAQPFFFFLLTILQIKKKHLSCVQVNEAPSCAILAEIFFTGSVSVFILNGTKVNSVQC